MAARMLSAKDAARLFNVECREVGIGANRIAYCFASSRSAHTSLCGLAERELGESRTVQPDRDTAKPDSPAFQNTKDVRTLRFYGQAAEVNRITNRVRANPSESTAVVEVRLTTWTSDPFERPIDPGRRLATRD